MVITSKQARQTGWPFQEGYVRNSATETHVFTDYRWNNGQPRHWWVNPKNVDLAKVVLRDFSLDGSTKTDQ